MANTIVGKTNGTASSEYASLKALGIIGGAVVSVAVIGGYVSPEQAATANELLGTFIGWAGSGVCLYIAARTLVKSILAKEEEGKSNVEA
jgi:hypothetical protein